MWRIGTHNWLLWDKNEAGTLKGPTAKGVLKGKDCTELAAPEKGKVDISSQHTQPSRLELSGALDAPSRLAIQP